MPQDLIILLWGALLGLAPGLLLSGYLRRRRPKSPTFGPVEHARLREQLASIEHERWADWQRYVHTLCTQNEDGSLTIPASRVTHWERQIMTPYMDLTHREKLMDMEQVDRYWHLLTPWLYRK